LMERVRTAPADQIGAVAFYDADRLHRNDLEFFRFMAEMTDRRILVFDGNGLISNVDRLSWKIRAIVAQEEREKVARRVRDNLRYLRRNGKLLGAIPQATAVSTVESLKTPRRPPPSKKSLGSTPAADLASEAWPSTSTGTASGPSAATTRPTTIGRRRSSSPATSSRTWSAIRHMPARFWGRRADRRPPPRSRR